MHTIPALLSSSCTMSAWQLRLAVLVSGIVLTDGLGASQSPNRGSNILPEPTDQELEEIDSFIQAGMACRRIPGVSLTVVRGQHVLMERGYGWADKELRRDVNPSTLFPVASLSKAFAVTLLAMLLQENQQK